MKNSAIILVLFVLISCTKKDVLSSAAAGSYQIRVAAVETSGAKSYTSISRVKSGKVAVAFETDEATGIVEYNVEVSTDGVNFKNVKTIAAGTKSLNNLYRDTVVLE